MVRKNYNSFQVGVSLGHLQNDLRRKGFIEMIRACLFFSGRVQGVGFRFTTNEVAKRFAVKGTVENCDDGRVKIIVEAESNEIDRFVEAIKSSMAGKIKQVSRFESVASFEFENFSVRQ